MLILVVSGITCAVVSTLLCYHLALAWYGKTQLEYGFGLDPGPTTVKGLAGVCEAFGRRGRGGQLVGDCCIYPFALQEGRACAQAGRKAELN